VNIFHVVPGLALRNGGPSVYVVGLSRALQELGATVTVFTTDASAPASAKDVDHRWNWELLPPGADELDIRHFPLAVPKRIIYAPNLSRALKEEIPKADIIHVHTLYLYPQLTAWRAASRAQVPYIVTPHGVLDPYLRSRGHIKKRIFDALWQRRMLDGAAALHLTSEDERRLVSDLKIRAPHVVVPNGVNLAAFEHLPPPSDFRERFLSGSTAPLVLNHGRIAEKKGLNILVEAMAQVRQIHPTAMLALVGPDDEGLVPNLQNVASRAGIGNAVHFVGMLQNDDLLAALAAADVWALPSHTENFGFAVVEAMAAGLPVVTSPHVNIAPEAASAGALVMVDNSPSRVATAISDLLAQPKWRAQLGCEGRCFVRMYDWPAVARKMYELYQSVLERTAP
jgi:glycosyltransferase involved in cell wall biosynthesis